MLPISDEDVEVIRGWIEYRRLYLGVENSHEIHSTESVPGFQIPFDWKLLK